MAIERWVSSMSVSALEPVVENPDIDSNSASTGRDSCGSPSR